MAEHKYFAAGAGKVEFNGVKVGSLTSIGWSENAGVRPVQVIGEYEVDEHVPTTIGGTMTCGFVKPRAFDEREMKLVGGRKSEDLIQGQEPLTVSIKDKTNAPAVAHYTFIGCKYTGGSWNMQAGDVLTGNMNYVWKRMLTKTEK